jgi:hypothetical protein
MTTQTTYPNSQTLTSSALTRLQIETLIQTLTCGMLGINPPNGEQVRINWPQQGQPFQDVDKDICYISCVTSEEQYTKVRDRQYQANGQLTTEIWTYTRNWRVHWTLYGPACTDRARMIWSALFMDYFNDQLNLSQLFPVSDPTEPTRIPEEMNAQWFDRADFHMDMYEAVTETIDDTTVSSVEVLTHTEDGLVSDITVTKP